jgi:hypothetical protein
MTKDPVTNLPASIHQRLLDLDPKRIYDFTPVLRRYAFERWLYRLGKSEYAGQFIVKGAMLFVVWTGDVSRKTMDLDLWGAGDLTEAGLRDAFLTVGRTNVEPDGLIFMMDAMVVEPIRDEAEFHGLRARFSARLGNIRIPLQVDIGSGDRIWPEPEYILYPTLLDMPAPRVQACRKETTIAEKFASMIDLGITNSRMKDFYDIAVLGDLFSFRGLELQKAIQTALMGKALGSLIEQPVTLTDGFAQDRDKNIQWVAFLRRIGKSPQGTPLTQAVEKIRRFLQPVLTSLKEQKEFDAYWPAGGPWRSQEKEHDG